MKCARFCGLMDLIWSEYTDVKSWLVTIVFCGNKEDYFESTELKELVAN